MKLKKNSLILLITVFYFSIGFLLEKDNFEDKIVRWIEKSCVNFDNCILNINDLTDFNWDKMYVFDEGFAEKGEFLEKEFGIGDEDNDPVKRKILFVKNGSVVFYNELPTNIEHSINNQVYFDTPWQDVFRSYTPDDAIFSVKKDVSSWYGIVYDLSRLKK